ncbi:2-oxoisovalerate dehydrogenase subunit beta [compost metagenome]
MEVIDLRSVRPIDYPTIIESVKKTNRLVIVEEAWPLASISSEITYSVQRNAFDYLDAPIVRITAADVPLPYAATLIEAALPSVAKVVKAVKEVAYIKK